MNSNETRVALVQMRCGPEPDKNFANAVEFVREAAEQGAQIICLPELFRSQYFCQSEDHKNFALAEEIPGRSTSALGDVAGDWRRDYRVDFRETERRRISQHRGNHRRRWK